MWITDALLHDILICGVSPVMHKPFVHQFLHIMHVWSALWVEAASFLSDKAGHWGKWMRFRGEWVKQTLLCGNLSLSHLNTSANKTCLSSHLFPVVSVVSPRSNTSTRSVPLLSNTDWVCSSWFLLRYSRVSLRTVVQLYRASQSCFKHTTFLIWTPKKVSEKY